MWVVASPFLINLFIFIYLFYSLVTVFPTLFLPVLRPSCHFPHLAMASRKSHLGNFIWFFLGAQVKGTHTVAFAVSKSEHNSTSSLNCVYILKFYFSTLEFIHSRESVFQYYLVLVLSWRFKALPSKCLLQFLTYHVKGIHPMWSCQLDSTNLCDILHGLFLKSQTILHFGNTAHLLLDADAPLLDGIELALPMLSQGLFQQYIKGTLVFSFLWWW